MTVIDEKNQVSYPLLTVCQVAQLIGVDKSTVYRWKKQGEIQKFNQWMVIFNEKHRIIITHIGGEVVVNKKNPILTTKIFN